MRRIPVRFSVLAVCLLLLNAAGLAWIRYELAYVPDPATVPLRVVETLPVDEADQAERLSIVFDRDAGELGSLNEKLDEAVPFEFSPKVAGHWEWSTPRRLDFVLAEPLPPGRRFEVVQAGGKGEQPTSIVQVDGEIEFRTRPLKWVASRLISSDRSDVTVELKFNQAVAPQELLRHLTTREAPADGAGDSDEWDVLTAVTLVNEPDESIVLRCPRPTSDRLFFELDGGLTGNDAELELGKTETQTLTIAPHFAYLRNQVTDAGNDQWQIDVYFLPSLKSDQDLSMIPVTPQIDGLHTNITTTWRGEGRVLRLRGPFESGREYRATLPQTLLSKDDKPLGEDTVVRFRIPERNPHIDFVHSRGILSPEGNLELDLQTVNVGSLHVHLERVHSNNLVAHLQNTWRRSTSRKLEGKTFRIDHQWNQTAQHSIRLRDVGAVSAGLYSVNARATDQAWTRDRALVAVSDLATTLKQSPGEMLVQVTSLRQGTSVSGVRVRSVSYNNQTLASGTTDDDGLVRLAVDRLHPDGRPWVVITEYKEQVAWIRTDDNHFVDDDVDQSGRPHDSSSFDVMLYTERGTYRPGDTIHLSGIIRDAQGQVPPAFPLSVHVIRPDGRTVATKIVKPGHESTHPADETESGAGTANRRGVFHFDFTTPDDAWTGPWRFRVTLPGADDELSSTHAYVEEFIPVRLEVKTAAQQALWTAEAPTVDADARYLFGSPAARLSGEATTRYRAVRFHSSAYPDFHFGDSTLPQSQDAQSVRFTLDEQGHAAIELPVAPELHARWKAGIGVTVTEDGGRSVSTQTDTIVDTLNHHVGLRMPAGGVVPAEADVVVESVVRTAVDEAAPFEPLRLELLHVQREHVLERVNGRLTWRSVEQMKQVWSTVMDTASDGGVGRLTLKCPQPGHYRLIAVCEAAHSRTVLEFSAVDESGHVETTSRPEQVDIRLNRPACRPGESLEAVITSPFPGRLLLSLEADRVLWSRVVSLEETSSTITINMPSTVRGGAFLSATVIRPVDPAQDDWKPHRASGLARIVTDHSAERIPVSINAPQSAEPGQRIEVTATAASGALIQIWAVDEGILATSGFGTPDPHGHFYAARSNGVITSDIFADLLPDYERPADFHRIGGDGGIDPLRRNSVATPRRAAVVIWQGFRRSNENGQVSLTTTLPDFTGELRWMVVAVDDFRFGSADLAMQVSSPLLVESSWPRCVAPGDRFRVPVKLFNTTDDALMIEAASITDSDDGDLLSSDTPKQEPGRLTYDGLDSLDIPFELPAGTSRIMWLEVTATRLGPIANRVEFIAKTSDGSSLDVSTAFVMSVRPTGTLSTTRKFLTLEPSAEVTVDVPPELLAEDSKSTLTISSEPALELQPAAESLLRYPYGCVEQTTSRMRAVLAASGWLSVATPETPEDQSLSNFANRSGTPSSDRTHPIGSLVDSGVSRLWSMQTRTGGLSYWPGQTEPNLWGSIWAAETLLIARDRGFEVDSRLIDGVQNYLTDSLSHSGGGSENSLDSNLRADVCQVLSRMGAPPTGWMSLLSERLNELDMAGRSQLALAWHHAGRRDRALAAMPADTLEVAEQVSYSGRFSSPTVQRARLLSALLEIDPEHVWITQLALKLHESRQNGVWHSTIENALAIDALAARQSGTDESAPFEGQLTVGDQQLEFAAGESRRLTFRGLTVPLQLTPQGTGQLYVSFETTGLSTNPPAELDRRLRVRRRWLDRHGDAIDPSAIRVGDLIQVEVKLSSIGRSTIQNIAIVDALPGGLDVENPRLKTSDAGVESSPADRVQFLDDRVLIFATATPTAATFRYALRAVTEGQFAQPAIQASCMYDETLTSIHGAGRIEISPAAERQKVERLADRKKAEEAVQ